MWWRQLEETTVICCDTADLLGTERGRTSSVWDAICCFLYLDTGEVLR